MIDPSIFLLLLVLGVLAAAPALLRRHRASAPDAVRVVGRTALHKNAVVAVVAVGERRLLVGTGERGVQLLAELDDQPGAVGSGTADEHDRLVTTTTSTVDRMDAAGTDCPTGETGTAQDALAGLDLGRTAIHAGPGTGLVDRLRSRTVRTPMPGRPLRVPLRR